MSLGRKPVQLTQNWRDVVQCKPSSGILDGLDFVDEAARQATEQQISIVQAT